MFPHAFLFIFESRYFLQIREGAFIPNLVRGDYLPERGLEGRKGCLPPPLGVETWPRITGGFGLIGPFGSPPLPNTGRTRRGAAAAD